MKNKIYQLSRFRTELLALLLFVQPFIANAKINGSDKTSFAVFGGVNFQNLNGKDRKGDMLKNKILPAYHFGVNLMIPIVPEFYFQPGIVYSLKGAKQKNDSFSRTVKINYLEMPLNFVYSALLGKGQFMLGFGPYIAYAIGGSNTYRFNNTDNKADLVFSSSSNSGNPDNMSTIKRFDSGANIFAGYQLEGGLFFQLNTQLGMVKINPEYSNMTDDKSVLKNTGFSISAGYRF